MALKKKQLFSTWTPIQIPHTCVAKHSNHKVTKTKMFSYNIFGTAYIIYAYASIVAIVYQY